jgi:hypothetical protein
MILGKGRLGDRDKGRRMRGGHEARATSAAFCLRATELTLVFHFRKRRVIVGGGHFVDDAHAIVSQVEKMRTLEFDYVR